MCTNVVIVAPVNIFWLKYPNDPENNRCMSEAVHTHINIEIIIL